MVVGLGHPRQGERRGNGLVELHRVTVGLLRRLVTGQAERMEQDTEKRLVQAATDELRVPFWVVLAGVGAGAVWALAGVLVGTWITRRRSG